MGTETILDELLRVARKDGVVTDDEQQLIESVRAALEAFAQARTRSGASAGGVKGLELASFRRRRQARQQVLDTAVEHAWLDGQVSPDERQLLLALLERLPRLGRPGTP